ncbi:MAG: hypothetical protein LIO93_12735 [Bacteroidales bacterium]|nr:hypothetical protein [Bacteroidales bacterium]
MRIAIILDCIYLIESGSSTKKILLFEVNDDLVTAIDEDMISIANINYLCLWLLAKRAVRLYCDGLTEADVFFLEKAGIEVYPLERIRGHAILQALLLKDKKRNG